MSGYEYVKHVKPGKGPLELPLIRVAPAILLCCTLSWLALYVDRKTFGGTPITRTPDWIAAEKRLGPVSERTDAPPVFRNPFRNNIPGNILGPEDVLDRE